MIGVDRVLVHRDEAMKWKVSSTEVLRADIQAEDGLIHTIDDLLLSPLPFPEPLLIIGHFRMTVDCAIRDLQFRQSDSLDKDRRQITV